MKKRVAAFVANLLDRSRFDERVAIVHSLDDLHSLEVDLLFLDLSQSQVLDNIPSGPRVIGFAPHVETELLEAAIAAGCDEALPRSLFFKRLPDILRTFDD